MRRAGHQIADIASECSVNESTIRRDLRILRNRGTDLGTADSMALESGRAHTGFEGERTGRMLRALDMRITGMTHAAIAAALGVGTRSVADYIEEALAETRAPKVEHLREITANRLDNALRKCVELLDHVDPNIRLKAAQRVTTIEAERAKLFGMYTPIRVDATVTEVTQQDLELQQMIDEARAQVAAREQQLREAATADGQEN